MKNFAFSANRQAESVSHQDLIDAMHANYEYSQDEIRELFDDRPRAAVMDALYALVAKGAIWRATARSPIKFVLLQGERLQEAIERKTTRGTTPAWMTQNLAGYDSNNARFRELCMSTRK